MKKILTVFFVTLGVIFFVLILAGVYFFVADPLNLRPLLFGDTTPVEQNETSRTATSEAASTSLQLSDEQAEALEASNIDSEIIPSDFTEAQVQCFEAELGAARVAEIRGGAVPTPGELIAARACL